MAETTQVLEFIKGIKQTDEIVEPDYATTSQTITNTTNAAGTNDKPSREDHTHAHGNLITPTHHAAATQANNGFMSAADKTKLDKIIYEVLQYTNSATITTSSTVGVPIPLNTDRESQAGTLLTKPTPTTFRTNFNGRVEITFRANVDNNGGIMRPATLWIRRAGTDLTWTKIFIAGRNSATRLASSSDTVEVNCSNGNDFELMLGTYDAAYSQTVRTDGARIYIKAVRLA